MLLDEAYPIARELDDDDLLMPVLQQRIRNQIDLDHFDEARRLATLLEHEMRRAGRNDLRAYLEGRRGLIENNLGHYDQAITHYEAALTEYEVRGHLASSAATNTRANLGVAYIWAGRLEDARRETNVAHAALVARFGAEHPNISASLINLSVLANASGDRGKAQEYAERNLEICESAYGAAHPKTADAQGQLAGYLLQGGKVAAAAALYESAAATIEKELGESNTRMALLLTNLAIARWHSGDRDQAVQTSARALRIKREILPADHPDLLLSTTNHAHMQAVNGDPEPALALVREAVKQRRARGDAPDQLHEAQALQALVAALAGDPKDARRQADVVLAMDPLPAPALTYARTALALVAEGGEARALAAAALATPAMKREPELRARMQAIVDAPD